MALVLAIFQTRYVPHLLLALTDGPQTFSALLRQARVPSAGTLSARLRDLQRWHLVRREGRLYSLLPAGRASFSVLRQMQHWARQLAAEHAAEHAAILQRAGSLGIVYALMAGPLRVRALAEQVRWVSRRSLLHRLQELTEAGFLERQDGDSPLRYALTPHGQTLRPVMEELTVWLSMYRALQGAEESPGETAGVAAKP